MDETLQNIKRRYLHERSIYTWCGIALVAVNPYQEQDIYGNQAVETYHSASHSVYLQLDPHVYAVTEDAYSKLERNVKNQSIIVSGESGAGKTVSAKHAMRYLASIASSRAKLRIENRVLASNPIMEAIGNASTVRNDNSSRFGKYIQIFFDRHNHKILGGNMRTYLLEKSRVTSQQAGERNFHIFYQLVNYAHQNPIKMAHLKLVDPENCNSLYKFKFLAGCDPSVANQGRDDLRKFNEALHTLNIDERRVDVIYRIVAAILHGGNIEFQSEQSSADESYDHGDGSCTLDAEEFHFKAFCELIGLDPEETKQRLTTKLLRTGPREIITQPLKPQMAEYARNAMLKYIYECLFTWLVGLINLSLGAKDAYGVGQPSAIVAEQVARSPSSKKSIHDHLVTQEPQFIGVLDIYGFENFKTNSFEQFCINYANEVLQQQYNQHVFKIEQEEYIREDIDWTFIDYYDNQPVIDIIESKPIGILQLLDEECRMPKGTDKSWCAKLYEHLLGLPGASGVKTPNVKGPTHSIPLYDDNNIVFKRPKINYQTSFTVCHYAEEVTYDVDTFLEKNRDTIAEEQCELLRQTDSLISCIFDDPLLSASARPRPKHSKSATVGHQFRGSLTALIQTLNATEPHYIRCIKPNDNKKAFEFNEERAVQQLKACGVYETIRISNNGFPSRWPYRDFAKRYMVLIHGTTSWSTLIEQLAPPASAAISASEGTPLSSLAITQSPQQQSHQIGVLSRESSGNGSADDDDISTEVDTRDLAQTSTAPKPVARLVYNHFTGADVRRVCETICALAYGKDSVYEELRTKAEQSYIDLLVQRHGDKPSAIYQFGKSKIFFRAGQVGYLERIRSQKLRAYTVTIQRHVRGWLARRSFVKRREEFLEQLRREASVVSLQNQVNSLQTELEQVKEVQKDKEVENVSRLGSVYQLIIEMLYCSIQPLIIGAVLEYEALDTPEPFPSLESRTPDPNVQPMDELLKCLDRFNDLMVKNSVPQDIAVQAFKQIFYFICAQSLNQLLIRRDLCQFNKAMQINFNLSCLVQWCRERYLTHWREIVEQLDPITQATKLLQTRKSSEDIATIGEVCNKLTPSQIIKILNMYTSSYEEQITIDFIHELEEYLINNDLNNNTLNNELLMDTKRFFAFIDLEADQPI